MLKNEKSKIQKLLHDFDFFSKISNSRLKIQHGNIVFDHRHDIPNIHTKSDNNRSDSFGACLSNKNQHRRRTDRQTDRRKLNVG